MDKVDQLKKLPIFAGCSRDELEVLAAHVDGIAFKAGERLIMQGEPNDTFFILSDGKVEVLVDETRRRELHVGDFFGEISMEGRKPATASVAARTDGAALVMSHAQYRALRGNDRVALRVREALEQRLAADRAGD